MSNNRLWTGKTAREELISSVCAAAAVSNWPVSDVFEAVLDSLFKDAESAPSGSIKSETFRYWNGLSDTGKTRLFGTLRRLVSERDLASGRNRNSR